MRYLMLIYQNNVAEEMAALTGEDQKAFYAEWAELNQTPGMTPGLGLDDPGKAITVRGQGGGEPLTTDGPFPEVKESLGGYFVLEADDVDAAVEVARRVPSVRFGASVEIRPLVERWS
jgi:hypothetical protein